MGNRTTSLPTTVKTTSAVRNQRWVPPKRRPPTTDQRPSPPLPSSHKYHNGAMSRLQIANGHSRSLNRVRTSSVHDRCNARCAKKPAIKKNNGMRIGMSRTLSGRHGFVHDATPPSNVKLKNQPET